MRRGGQSAANAAFGILLALALLLSYVEVLLPLSIGIPGVKLGLANLASLVCLYLFGIRRAALLSVLRIVLTGFLFGNMAAILYSLSGAVLSLTAAALAKRSGGFSELGVSVLGAVFHNLGQLIVASLVVQNRGLFWYFPLLLLAGVIMGALIGLLTAEVLKHLPASLCGARD